MRKVIMLVLSNIVVLGFLLFSINAIAIATMQLYHTWFVPLQHFADAHLLPNYQGAAWAKKHFLEFNELNGDYVSYYGWRRHPYAGETINIDEHGLRRTYRDETVTPEHTIAFFGGSTTWGSGADDDHTIPSEFIKLNPEYLGYNFGESGYVAHQSLNLFLERYFDGFRPDVVVFYDGVNEVWSKCQYQLGPYSHWQESNIRRSIREARAAGGEPGASNTDVAMVLIQPIKTFVEKATEKLTLSTDNDKPADGWQYDCHDNRDKAIDIARVLLSDWQIVKDLVESYGGTFVPILQPVIYFSNTKTEHLDVSEALRWQFDTVYPLIFDVMNREFPELAASYMDLRDALDRDEYVYIDWCHLSPNGNRLIAERISQGLAARTGKAMALAPETGQPSRQRSTASADIGGRP